MLIGLHGKKQAGKDTVYERLAHLLGAHGATVERVSFADKLYESAAAALGVTGDELREWKSDPAVTVRVEERYEDQDGQGLTFRSSRVNSTFTIREFLQHYGTEAHRDVFGPNFWVDNVDLTHEGRVVVVTDVRFRNEAQAVIDAGGSVVHVIGPADVENAGDGHASEETLPERYVDHVLVNALRHDDFRALDSEVRGLFLCLRRVA